MGLPALYSQYPEPLLSLHVLKTPVNYIYDSYFTEKNIVNSVDEWIIMNYQIWTTNHYSLPTYIEAQAYVSPTSQCEFVGHNYKPISFPTHVKYPNILTPENRGRLY